ncbi:hypothetical protein EMIHUDRAFT_194924 [Emiliania huxleyi CCMP1516]|uniref:CSD domain-containing protein n=2 Tax=Emiliania huxleyi TaxID=2903 RepID=A0A0D3L2C7_EMIH1|nr:hypothetical protein EMIHUDRAFT_194924 [Emiliania huxleyi CCMP1516]EOD42162.1 hypothetical protein EMIHUDRAFT_194924 [Emiliania huxleyi CCMP1516]|eukprot:XP_005794591.1 hypothetical protein EMIHUDRAFT_194924 [Emiliania huxleyi CCMP1516]
MLGLGRPPPELDFLSPPDVFDVERALDITRSVTVPFADGYGFICPADGGQDLFCHRSAIEDGDALGEGFAVGFERVFDSERRPRAERVRGGIGERRGSLQPRAALSSDETVALGGAGAIKRKHSQAQWAESFDVPGPLGKSGLKRCGGGGTPTPTQAARVLD